ncbi:MAG TPA: dTDP-4-dehydrorhamnose reductase [Candidatus Binatia bacterium]|jgi:dTDP-4-dehydrorhamnose reductase|nr:dTDP-4-dehydrorhamnose reductase [Candidatus Binatia bacterium]
MKVLILGAKGNLGQDLVRAFGTAGCEVDAFDREQLDITDAAAVRARIAAGGYGAVVNAAAYNNVDAAEDPANAGVVRALNVDAPGVMAEAARDAGAAFVHYSSDYVFEGEKPEGYAEDDEPNPVSAYGRSKLDGERVVAAAGGAWYVVRTSKLYGIPGTSAASKPSFVTVMTNLAKTKPELSIVDEEVGMPTYTADLAAATVRLVSETFKPGIYHLVNEGPGVTWYGFAGEFFGLQGIATPRKPVPMSAFPRPAKRPRFAALRNTKFPPLRPRIEALKAFFAEAREKA